MGTFSARTHHVMTAHEREVLGEIGLRNARALLDLPLGQPELLDGFGNDDRELCLRSE